MIMSVSNSPSFGLRVPKGSNKLKKVIYMSNVPKPEFHQKKIDSLSAQIDVINLETDSLYKYGYDEAGRLMPDIRAAIARNNNQVAVLKDKIAGFKEEIARRFSQTR